MARPQSSAFEGRLRAWMAASDRRFEASMAGDVLELSMLDIVGEDWWTGGGITSKGVQEKLAANPKAKTIKILLNSPGGDAFEGLAIQSLLRRHGANVEIEVVGLAASAASIIAMAGDTIAMHEGSLMMVHEPWTFAVGDAAEMRTTADFLDKVNSSGLDVYARRTGRPRADVAKIVADETWMTAHEAVKEKFANSVVTGAQPEPQTKARAAAQVFMSMRQPARQQASAAEKTAELALLSASLPEPHAAPPAPIESPATPALPSVAAKAGSNPERSNHMQFSAKVLALLGLPENADQAAIEAAITEKCEASAASTVALSGVKIVGASTEAEASAKIVELQKTSMELMANTGAGDRSEAIARIAAWRAGSEREPGLLKQLAELKNDVRAAKRDAAVDRLSKEGRLSPSQHDWARANFQDAESLETFALTIPPMHSFGPSEPSDPAKAIKLDVDDRKICLDLGISEELYLEQKKLDLQSAKARKAG